MYVCICNALTESHVDDAVRSGADRPAKVYRHHSCRVQCGKCVREVEDRLRESSSADPTQQGLAVLND